MEPIRDEENRIKPARTEAKGPVVVETYANDMAEVLEHDTEGLVKKIIHGEEQHEAEKKNLSPQSRKNKLFMLLGLLMIVSAVAVLAFLFLNRGINTVPVEKQFTPLIFNDLISYQEITGLTKEEIMQAVLNEVNNTPVKIGGVEGIYLRENNRTIGLRRFISAIEGNFTPNRDPFFVSDNFLMGVVNVNKNDKPRTPGEGFFLLLKVRETADIFNDLRNWERKMFLDLHNFIGVSLSADTKYLLTKDFEEGVVDNRSARVLYDNNDNIVLTYVFADENSVVITNSADALHEIVLRLASASQKQ